MIREGYQLYQMKSSPLTRAYIFQPYLTVSGMRYYPKEADYDLVYDTPFATKDDLPSICKKLEIAQQKQGHFRAVSISDVIVLYKSGEVNCYYIDRGGFTLLYGFFEEVSSAEGELSSRTEHYVIAGKNGLWRTVDTLKYESTEFFLMECQKPDRQAFCIILDSKGQIVDDKCDGDFDAKAKEKIRKYLHPKIPNSMSEESVHHDLHENRATESSDHIDDLNNNGRRWIPPKNRKSVLVRLREKQALLHGKK